MPVCIVLLNQFAPNGGGGRIPWFSASSMSCFTTSFAVPSEGGENVWVGECKGLLGVGVCLAESEVEVLEETKRTKEMRRVVVVYLGRGIERKMPKQPSKYYYHVVFSYPSQIARPNEICVSC